jgi:phenylalanyl-tRNA synthetase beta chain
MKISLNWLKQYIDLPEPAQEIANLLTRSGLEVEGVEEVETIKGGLKGLVIGEVLTCTKHPDADKLSLTTVDIGNGNVSPIVCGASNVRAGQKVVVATVGTTLYPTTGEPFTIKKAKIRGEVSEGMICAEDEIGLGTSHEGIMVLDTQLPNGSPAAAYFHLESDYVLEIGLTPNRADAASHVGVVRDLKALLRRPYQLPEVDAFAIDNTRFPIPVTVENTEACPRYCGLTISGLTVKESPEWLRKRLEAIDLTPINNVVDVTNFVLHELGQPLHAFDADQITGGSVIVKTLPEGTPFVTLDGQERKLASTDLMICNTEEPMCIAGVFGGAKSGVKNETTRIFLESACFSPDSIRKTSQFHGLKTDASFRFERGTDPNLPVYALKRAALLIQEVAGGEISSDIVDVYPQPIPHAQIEVTYRNIARLMGKSLDRGRIREILESLDIQITQETEEGLQLSVPPYRVDVTREADVVEEILRIYGLDNIDLTPHLSTSYLAEFPAVDKNKLQFRITQSLAANGFHEIITNSLTKPAYAAAIRPFNYAPGDDVQILNKLSEDLGVMRQTLLFSGLEALAYNINRRQKNLKAFEFGKIYYRKEGKYVEKSRIALFLTGSKQAESWQTPTKPGEFHDLASTIAKVLSQLNVKNVSSQPVEKGVWQYGLTYQVNKKDIVTFGLLNPQLAKLADVKQPVFYADFDWDYLSKQYRDDLVVEELSKYPEVRRDLSLVIDKGITFEEIRNLALKYERNLLRSINVFDVYEGENIGKDKKSYSVSFILQDNSQTLTDQVIDRTMQKLITTFEKELNAVIRK